MNKYFAWSLVCVPAFLPVAGQTVNPSNQINWPLVTGSGAPTATCNATNYGQPYTDTTANKDYKCGSAGWFPIGSGGTSSFTSNVGVGANNSSAYAAVNEVNYKTTGGNTAFACEEDQNRGDWDVRCIRGGVSWASNPSQALINTISAGVCYHYTQNGPWPTVHIPRGSYSAGGNISHPPNVDIEGAGGSEYGGLTVLTTTDPTQPMFTDVSSQTFTCNGTNYTDNAGTVITGNIYLQGGGSANANDVGISNNTGGATNEYIHNIGFQNFGGPGRNLSAGANGQNSRGHYILAIGNLQWYMFSGAYNTSGFTDNNAHCSLELYDLDSRWDHIEATGNLPDTGYYNRYNLIGVCIGGGGQNSWLKDSYIQLFPRDVYIDAVANGGQLVSGNRLDGSWWEAIDVGAGAIIANNLIQGYDISPTLNPANFATNPGGVTTDANAAAIKIYSGALGSTILPNSIGAGIWSQWPIYGVWSSPNVINGATTTIDLPGAPPGSIGGQLGGDSGTGNVGADVVRSLHQTSSGNHANAGGAIHFQGFAHTYLNDSAATNYTTADGIWPDTYVTIEFRGTNDTITGGSGINLCGAVSSITSGIHWFYTYDTSVLKEVCPTGGGGGGGVSGSGTGGFLPLWSGSGPVSVLANSLLDYNISAANMFTFAKPVSVNDGSGLGGQFDGTEGTAPTGVAGQDIMWADSGHALKHNDNAAGAVFLTGIATAGTSGNTVAIAANGHDIIDNGPDGTAFTPTKVGDTGLGTGGATTLQAGSNDANGWFTFTVGTSPAGAGAGLITITFGGTYSAARKCVIYPYNALAFTQNATSNAATVLPGNSTATNFVVTPANSTAFTASTGPYGYFYRCGK